MLQAVQQILLFVGLVVFTGTFNYFNKHTIVSIVDNNVEFFDARTVLGDAEKVLGSVNQVFDNAEQMSSNAESILGQPVMKKDKSKGSRTVAFDSSVTADSI